MVYGASQAALYSKAAQPYGQNGKVLDANASHVLIDKQLMGFSFTS